MHWQVYLVRCSDRSLYTGITTDVERRLRQHRAGTGAKFFRGRSPLALVYLETGHSRSSASRREAAIKALSRGQKEQLLRSPANELESEAAKALGS